MEVKEIMLETIEIFALIIAVLVLVKILVILIKPKAWMNFAESLWKMPMLVMIVGLILAGVVLYYLMQSGIGLVQIFGVMLFVVLLSAVTMAVYAKDFISMAKKLVKDRQFMSKGWLPILIWVVLAVWVLIEIFA